MKFIPNGVSRPISRLALKSQKHSPSILFAAGSVGVVATAVLAARATLKLDDTLTEISQDLHAASNNDRERLHAGVDAYLRIGKLYAPTVVVGVASIGCLAGSHRILTKRNAALTAAYSALEKTFDRYRARVVEEYGEDKDREFRQGHRTELVTNDKGKEVKAPYVDANGISVHARFFDDTNQNWVRRAESNLVFLKAAQAFANNQLHSRGHVLLNDIYDALGFERTKAGCVLGWTLDDAGDGYIDFGMYNPQSERARMFVNGDEYSILLDFNVDGIVYDKI